MKIHQFLALIVLSLATVSGARGAVLAGPITNAVSGHIYYLLSANSWTASEAEARGLGGHLVTIDDAAENRWVLDTFFFLTGVHYSSLWIGLNDAAHAGQFVWANGEPVTFTNWYPGVGGEDYAAIRHPTENWPLGSWKSLSDNSGLQDPAAPTYGVVELTVAVTLPADQFIPGSARLNGLANPGGSPTSVWFEWGTSLAYGNTTPSQFVGAESNFVTFSNVLIGLVSKTDYHFRTRASNAFGFFAGVDKIFNLNAQLPLVTTLAADPLSYTSARLKGQANPHNWPTAAWFEWGTTTNYGNSVGMQDIGQGSSASYLNGVLDGLATGPIYHYRLVATNAFGLVYGADQTINLSVIPTKITWTGVDASGYWSAPANWFPAGVPTNGADLVFPGASPADMISTNDLIDGLFRSITFEPASRHTIRGNSIMLTNRANAVVNNGTNVIACDLAFTGTTSTPGFGSPTIRGSRFNAELTVVGNVGGGALSVAGVRMVIRGQFTGGSIRLFAADLALYGDNPNPVSLETQVSTIFIQGLQPNLDINMQFEMESASASHLSGDGVIGDVTGGFGHIALDSVLSAKTVILNNWLDIHLNGTNVGEYGKLVASGDVRLSGGHLLPSPGFNPLPGQVFTILEKTSPGPILGRFGGTGEFLGPEGTITYLNGIPGRISYVGGDGNEVTLTVVALVPIVIGAIQRSYGTQSVFSYSADIGLRYEVERSTTLSNWATIWSNTANVNPMTFTDVATNGMNFYRIRRLPGP